MNNDNVNVINETDDNIFKFNRRVSNGMANLKTSLIN